MSPRRRHRVHDRLTPDPCRSSSRSDRVADSSNAGRAGRLPAGGPGAAIALIGIVAAIKSLINAPAEIVVSLAGPVTPSIGQPVGLRATGAGARSKCATWWRSCAATLAPAVGTDPACAQ